MPISVRARRLAVAAVLATSALAGCAPPFEEPYISVPGGLTCSNPEPAIQIGTGDLEFVPLEPGDPVTIYSGPQGGWHIFGSVITTHFGPIVDLGFTVTDPDIDPAGEIVIASSSELMALQEGSDCLAYMTGVMAFFDETAFEHLYAGEDLDSPCELFDGRTVRMRMELTEFDTETGLYGETLVAEVEVVAYPVEGCETFPEG